MHADPFVPPFRVAFGAAIAERFASSTVVIDGKELPVVPVKEGVAWKLTAGPYPIASLTDPTVDMIDQRPGTKIFVGRYQLGKHRYQYRAEMNIYTKEFTYHLYKTSHTEGGLDFGMFLDGKSRMVV